MKVVANTEFTISFEMKDKVTRTFKVPASNITEARAILTDHFSQCLDQLEIEDKKEKEKNTVAGAGK